MYLLLYTSVVLYLCIPHQFFYTLYTSLYYSDSAVHVSKLLDQRSWYYLKEHQKMHSSHRAILLPWKSHYHYHYGMSSLLSVAWLTLPLSLTNQIFPIRALCQNDLCEYCAKHCWHLDHTVKSQVSLDSFLTDTNIESEHCAYILLRSLHLKGWALVIVDLITTWPQTPHCYCSVKPCLLSKAGQFAPIWAQYCIPNSVDIKGLMFEDSCKLEYCVLKTTLHFA